MAGTPETVSRRRPRIPKIGLFMAVLAKELGSENIAPHHCDHQPSFDL
jgi:hypothetical protein